MLIILVTNRYSTVFTDALFTEQWTKLYFTAFTNLLRMYTATENNFWKCQFCIVTLKFVGLLYKVVCNG